MIWKGRHLFLRFVALLVLADYYRQFIDSFATIVESMTKLA